MKDTEPSKQALLRIFLSGLKKRNRNQNMSLLERKRAIKFSAHLAMASARKDAKHQWSTALMADLSKTVSPSKQIRRNKILSGLRVNKLKCEVKASSIARCMVKKRELVLRKLVPGGKYMDECTLLDETLDYLKLLKAQVDVMRLLVKTLEPSQEMSTRTDILHILQCIRFLNLIQKEQKIC